MAVLAIEVVVPVAKHQLVVGAWPSPSTWRAPRRAACCRHRPCNRDRPTRRTACSCRRATRCRPRPRSRSSSPSSARRSACRWRCRSPAPRSAMPPSRDDSKITRLPSGEKRRRSSPGPVAGVRRLRVAASDGDDPEMRRLGVGVEVDVDRAERHPLAVGRNDGFADALELHHVFEGEGMLGLGLSEERERRAGRKECDVA